MLKPVSISELVDEMQLQNEELTIYMHKETGEFEAVMDHQFQAAERDESLEDYPEWEQETIETAADIMWTDEYLKLPSQFEINEWEIMRDFCYTVEDEEVKEELLFAIHGNGAFRHFKHNIAKYGVREDWFKYRNQKFAQIAESWCQSNDLEYEMDL